MRRIDTVRVLGVSFALAGAAFAGATARAASFTPLGFLPGDYSSGAAALSADGSVVVGNSSSASRSESVRWTAAGGLVGLGDLPDGDFSGGAGDVSADGSVVVGVGNGSAGYEAFRWTAAGGMIGLGSNSVAWGVSADGSVVVGRTGSEAFRWTLAEGMVGLGDLAGGSFASEAKGVSADGSVVVGDGTSASGSEAFRWTSAGGMIGLGDLPGGPFSSTASAVSADGGVVVGMSFTSSAGAGYEAFRWTLSDGMVSLGDLPQGHLASFALGVSPDGSIIVGQANDATGHRAVLWTAAGEIQAIDQLLIARGVDLAGWTLSAASAISDDGLTIAGYGTNPDGNYEGWIAVIPEPSSALLLGLGIVALGRARLVRLSLPRGSRRSRRPRMLAT